MQNASMSKSKSKSKKMFTARLCAVFLTLTLVAAACGDDSSSTSETTTTTAAPTTTASSESEAMGTVVDVAVASGSFPTLVAAVQAAGLVGTLSGDGPFTVLAPTEDAFAAALAALGLSAEELLADTELLTAVLTYHVLPVEAPAEVVVSLDGQSVATVNGAEVMITVDGSTVMVNDATVVQTDIEASNGVIHVIDAVLLPPSDPPEVEPPPTTTEAPAMDDEAMGTVVDVAVASGSFPTLVAAVQAAGLAETLSGDGPFTVLAPTEDAFADLLAMLGMPAEAVLGNVELLTSVLTYHVLPVEAPAEVVVSLDGQSVATVNGAEVTITVDGSTVMVNDATVVATDIKASNGIIHVIDKVLFPPS